MSIPQPQVSLTRRRASTMDKREVSQTRARTAKLFRPMMTSAAPLVASRKRMQAREFIPGTLSGKS